MESSNRRPLYGGGPASSAQFRALIPSVVKPLRFAALLSIVFPASCALFGPRTDLRVRLPEPPEQWSRAFADLRFSLVFRDGSGTWRTVTVTDRSQAPVVSCWKAGNTPVLAYPTAARAAGYLRPAGGLYPEDCVDGSGNSEITLSWGDGCLAYVFKLLAERGFDTSLVNAGRLASCFGRHADPWSLDLDAVAQKLAQGDFSAYDIDLLPARDVTLSPGAGEWFLESPFASTNLIITVESMTLPALSVGMHALFSTRGGAFRICVGERETVTRPLE